MSNISTLTRARHISVTGTRVRILLIAAALSVVGGFIAVISFDRIFDTAVAPRGAPDSPAALPPMAGGGSTDAPDARAMLVERSRIWKS